MADALLEMKKAKLRKLKEMTAPRRMDVRVTDALKMMNHLTKTREKKSTTVMYKLMTVPKDSFVLPFRTDFIS